MVSSTGSVETAGQLPVKRELLFVIYNDLFMRGQIRWLGDLNIKPKTLALLKGIKGSNIYDFESGNS